MCYLIDVRLFFKTHKLMVQAFLADILFARPQITLYPISCQRWRALWSSENGLFVTPLSSNVTSKCTQQSCRPMNCIPSNTSTRRIRTCATSASRAATSANTLGAIRVHSQNSCNPTKALFVLLIARYAHPLWKWSAKRQPAAQSLRLERIKLPYDVGAKNK